MESPVKVETMLFTLVDPNKGHEVAYNRWYERDHFYGGCMIGPWLFAGGRFVATRRLKDLRFPSESPFAQPVDAGSYLAIYWMHEGHVDEHLDWAGKQVRRLYADGRGFAERTHAHTGLYDLASVAYRDADPVPLELALDHKYPGLAVTVLEPVEGATAAGVQEGPGRTLLAAGSPFAICASFTVRHSAATGTANVPMALGTDGGAQDRILQLWFADSPVADVWPEVAAYAAAVADAGLGVVTFAAPFQPTVVGTDRYTDELW
ncbi:MAG TPA: hypothetical protein VGS21_09250 [Acidimicrobiales bacterium]|nr:hypothetical protein [Acidimicrobiales bacterium]